MFFFRAFSLIFPAFLGCVQFVLLQAIVQHGASSAGWISSKTFNSLSPSELSVFVGFVCVCVCLCRNNCTAKRIKFMHRKRTRRNLQNLSRIVFFLAQVNVSVFVFLFTTLFFGFRNLILNGKSLFV